MIFFFCNRLPLTKVCKRSLIGFIIHGFLFSSPLFHHSSHFCLFHQVLQSNFFLFMPIPNVQLLSYIPSIISSFPFFIYILSIHVKSNYFIMYPKLDRKCHLQTNCPFESVHKIRPTADHLIKTCISGGCWTCAT